MSARREEINRLRHLEEDTFHKSEGLKDSEDSSRHTLFARDWLAASASLLREHGKAVLETEEGGSVEPRLYFALVRAANLIEALSCGRTPKAVKDAIGTGGRPEWWPGERADIAVAIQYIELAKAGALKDHRFIVTVSEAFQVDRTTVYLWQKDKERICDGIPQSYPHQFPIKLKEAGARYHFNRTGERTEGVE